MLHIARTAVALVFGFFLAPVLSDAHEPSRTPLIGVILPRAPEHSASRIEALRKGLQHHSYIEGKNIVLEFRFGAGNPEPLTRAAAELVARPVDVIVASGSQAIQAAKNATSTIPIVFAIAADPIASSFIASFERPGSNITGVSDSGHNLSEKRLELLKEAFPAVSRVAVIGDAAPPQQAGAVHILQTTARKLGISLLFPEIRGPKDI